MTKKKVQRTKKRAKPAKKKTIKLKPRKKPKKPKVQIPTDLDNPEKFEMFIRWYVLSPVMRLFTDSQITALGIKDELESELLKIGTQKEFAAKYKIHQDTLTDWKKREDFQEKVDGGMKLWGKSKTPTVLLSLLRNITKKGGSQEVKLWLQFFQGFTEKQEHTGADGRPIEMTWKE